MKTMILSDFLTPKEISAAWRIWSTLDGDGDIVNQIRETVIQPNIGRINSALGQDNDPRYLAYAVLYVLNRAAGG